MPAIQPVRLKQHAAQLAEKFADPAALVRGLHEMLEFYAERTRRPGQSGKPGPLAMAYKVHPPVLRQVYQELAPRASAAPEQALALCDVLWQQPYLEFRQLASLLLGVIPVEAPVEVTQRLQAWLVPSLEEHLVQALLSDALLSLRREQPQAIVQLAQDWLDRASVFHRHLGLAVLLPLINAPEFENLPVFFRLVHPLVRQSPSALRPDVLDVLEALARRSPKETAYFLRQTLSLPNCPDTPWFIRQLLPVFPEEVQKRLREDVRRPEAVPGDLRE
ncbi:MAG: DNA alkylation repair protein [Chloroflexota bacterium]